MCLMVTEQDVFWASDRVGFLSIHRFPFYPGSGSAQETGKGKGLGFTSNLPIEFGTTRREYMSTFETELGKFAAKLRPDLVMISAGFDSHAKDPIGSLGLETEDFKTLSDVVINVANQYAHGRIVSVLEGGYNVDVLPDCVGLHLQQLISAATNA